MASYTLAYYPLLILFAAVLWLIYALISHQFQTVLAFFLDMYPGVISEQTVSAANFAATCLVCSPAVFLIAIAVWALIRSVGSEGTKMAGTTPTTMLRAILLCMGCCISGLILATVGGPVLDIIHDQFFRMGFFDLPPEWDTTTHTMMLVGLFYAIPYLLPMFGLFVLIVTVYHRYREEQEENEDEYWIRGGQM